MSNFKRFIGASVAMLVLGIQVASAHTDLKTSSPADGSTVQAAPKELKLTFEGAVQLTTASVTGKDGKAIRLESIPKEAKAEFTLALPALTPGSYTVNWRAAGHDGHVMSGHLKFTVAGSAAK